VVGSAQPRLNGRTPVVTAAALAWFLFFPSLGIVQKYIGTTGALAYGLGLLLLAMSGARRLLANLRGWRGDGSGIAWSLVAMYVVLVAGFVSLYPIANAHAKPATAGAAVDISGSDRDESLVLGVREVLARRYPYYQVTYLNNPVTQLPGSLLLAIPFAVLGDAVWQNLFWLAALFVITRYLVRSDRLTAVFLVLIVFASPAVLQDFITGGDLGVNAIAILTGMLAIVMLAPDRSVAPWKKASVAMFTGIALSSRLNYLLLLPVLFGAVARRAGLRDAVVCLIAVAFAFTVVTLPFYWHDPIGFAPLQLHDKFMQFDDQVRSSGVLFPALSVLLSVLIALHPGNKDVGPWLMQCGLVLAVPVLFLVALATIRAHALNFAFTSYALASVFFGGLGAGLTLINSETI
jgi:hypothetical protein